MKYLIFSIYLILLLSCQSENRSSYDSNYSVSYEEAKETLEDKEKTNPIDFLDAKYTYRRNLIDQWVLEGTITNLAKIANYKDVTVRIIYYSKTDSEMGAENKTIFEYFKPGKDQKFKIKTYGIKDAEYIKLEFHSAEVL